jgi:hypothetical protein
MSDAPSFPTLPVLDTHVAPDGAAAVGVVHDLALGAPRRLAGEFLARTRSSAPKRTIPTTGTADSPTAGDTR